VQLPHPEALPGSAGEELMSPDGLEGDPELIHITNEHEYANRDAPPGG